ncbi:hypothetical protein VHEMI02539 [[Torrubiella] hemipterigena]|nr:hypothetical protein VHEMI02539 [[Torrubiella] hemipterigena]
MLEQAKSSPDLNNYLALLLTSAEPPAGLQCTPQDYALIRPAAGTRLKNNILEDWDKIPANSLPLIKSAIMIAIQDVSPSIRNPAAYAASSMIRKGGVLGWPELLPNLVEIFNNTSGSQTTAAQEGAMSAMFMICEDNHKLLAREVNGERPLNFLLPQLIAATKSPLVKVRTGTLKSINIFAPVESQAMLNSIDELLQHLFVLATDPSVEVRTQVCLAFSTLVEARPDKIMPHLPGLVDYILTQQKDEDEALACEASEFWIAIGEHRDLWKALEPYLSKIIPVLLECMVYSGEEIAMLGGQSDDDDEDDRQEDIKPKFAKRKAARAGNANKEGDKAEENYEKLSGMDDDDLDEGEVEEEEYDDDDDGSLADDEWTVRKGSAAALDVFAGDFGAPVFESILPYLSQNLKHADWPQREAAVLALGAVAKGCMDAVTPHLPELVPYLISLLQDPEPVVRTITCWALGRYSPWAASLPEQSQREQYFLPMMDGMLQRMLDKNKKVQEAAASAFAHLEDDCGQALEPYCEPIVKQFVVCLAKYKDRNMYILYDCIQSLAEQVGAVLAQPHLVQPLMGGLIARYNNIADDSREIFPLLECLSYVALALRDAFVPYAQPIFTRCMTIIQNNLQQALSAASNPNFDEPEKDFLVTSLDLISSIIQALEEQKAVELVQSSPFPFFDLLGFCLEDPADEVRQSAFALLGDSSRFIYPLLSPHLPTIMPMLLKQLDMDNILDERIDQAFGVVSNACWSSGEITLQHGKGMAPWINDLLKRFVEIMTNPRVPPGLHENAAIALGRLGESNAELLAPALPNFAEDFLRLMQDVDYSEEKATAFLGFSMIVGSNPQAMESVLLEYFTAIAEYEEIGLHTPLKQRLEQVFCNIFTVYKQLIPQFDEFIGRMSPQNQQKLKANYGI